MASDSKIHINNIASTTCCLNMLNVTFKKLDIWDFSYNEVRNNFLVYLKVTRFFKFGDSSIGRKELYCFSTVM